jgi:hypothetical protein
MYGLKYYCPIDNMSVTNDSDQDVLEFVNGSGVAVVVHQIRLSSSYTSDERVRLRLLRRSTTGSGGSAATEKPALSINTVAAALAVSSLVTAPGTAGDILWADWWHQLSPWDTLLIPELRITIPPSGRLGLNLETAVGSTRNWSAYAAWEEIG